jgi:hypothetical protein
MVSSILKRTTLLGTALLCLLSSSVEAGNPFSSNVIALTPDNWKKEVLESPHAVFVNVCRQG